MKDIHYILCSEGRSGTHYLRYLLRKFHLGVIHETRPVHMSLEDVPHMPMREYQFPLRQWKHNFLVADVHEGEALVYSRWIRSNPFSEWMDNLRRKADALDVSDADLLEHIYPGIKFIYLRREDYVKQAISFIKGNQLEQWLSFTPSVEKEPEYRFSEIAERSVLSFDSRTRWAKNFVRYNIEDPLEIVYEDFCEDPVKWLLRIKEYLGITNDVPITAEAVQMHMEGEKAPQRQSDHINTEWEKRFYRDLEILKERPWILKKLQKLSLPVDNEKKG